MKPRWVWVGLLLAGCVAGQDKAQVLAEARAPGSESGKLLGVLGSKAASSPDQDAAEFGKLLALDCSAIEVAADGTKADYKIVVVNASPKKNRDLRANAQIEVTNRLGKSVGTNFLHTSGNAVMDACELVDADWKLHGKLSDAAVAPSTQTGVVAASPSAPEKTTTTPGRVIPEPIPAGLQTGSSTGVAVGGSTAGEDMGEAARRAKQHAACLKLARENPSITCK